MSPQVANRSDAMADRDLLLRLDVLDKRGVYFRNPVKTFGVVVGPAGLGGLVSFAIYQTKGLSSLEILRNITRDSSTAVTIQSYDVASLVLNQPIKYLDDDPTTYGKTAFYWVRATPLHTKFRPTLNGPIALAIPANGTTALLPPAAQADSTSFATVDSIDAGADATIRIYGAAGGPGTSWTRKVGNGASVTYPPGTILHAGYTTDYYVSWNGSAYQNFTTLAPSQAGNLVPAGRLTTVASGGGGGTSGGGGTAGDSKGGVPLVQ